VHEQARLQEAAGRAQHQASAAQEQAKRSVLELQHRASALAARLTTRRFTVRSGGAPPPSPASRPRSPRRRAPASPPPRPGGEGLTLGSSVKNLGELLSPRGVLSPFRVEEDEDEAPRGFVYDPRLLIFEFVSTLLLREEQVRLVEKFLDAPWTPPSHLAL